MTITHKVGTFQGNGIVQGKPSAMSPSKKRDDLHAAHQLFPARAVARQVTPRKDTGLRSDKSSDKSSHPLKKRTRLFQDDTNQTGEVQVAVVDTEPKARRLLFDSEEQSQESGWSQADTQEVDYDACSQVKEQDRHHFFLHDVYGYQVIHLQGEIDFLIGRERQNDLVVPSKHVSKQHCKLSYQDGKIQLQVEKQSCWVETDSGKWLEMKLGTIWRLSPGRSFRLLKPSNEPKFHQAPGIQFSVLPKNYSPNQMDHQYLELLNAIKREGTLQVNKKGENMTLPQAHTLALDLFCEDRNKMILPITSLRKIWHQGSKIEALWYLRGDDGIIFLQNNRCSFWDAQANGDGFLGLNYGLLVNFPKRDGSRYNQLETDVIDKLVAGKSSRNMCCSMANPSEDAEQKACTSSIQFAVCDGRLNLTVTQRSSDVILGLPHDVIVWSIISHLVRREVRRRSNGRVCLEAGMLYFTVSAGGAHVYKLNDKSFKELLTRQPIPNVQPHLVIDGEEEGIFEIAQKYRKDGKTKLRVLGYNKDDYHPSMQIDQAV
jgi:thymidylate synthase